MSLADGMVLYHGSFTVVERPDLSRCARYKDFGRGFYVTTSYEQACNFVRLSVRKAQDNGSERIDPDRGYVSCFVVKDTENARLSVLEFADANSDWLSCVVAHRRRHTYANLVENMKHYDVIAGKIANDRTNITLALYMDGVFGKVGSPDAENACIAQLLPNRLKDQYCFGTERALGCLRFEGANCVWM